MKSKISVFCLVLSIALAFVSMATQRTDEYKCSLNDIAQNKGKIDIENAHKDSNQFSGMSKVVIKINNSNGEKKELKQEMFYNLEKGKRKPCVNTIFVIQDDFELTEDILIPKGCVLKFEGGYIRGNHSITGQYTCIEAGLVKIFDTTIVLKGTWNVIDLYTEWFGALGDGQKDDIDAIQHTIDMASYACMGIYSVKLINNKTYKISKHLNIPPRINLSSTYLNRDKSYDSRNKPKILVTGNDDAIHFVTEKGLGNSLGFIVLNNIAIIGSSSSSNKGVVCEDKAARYIEKCRLSGLYISNFKYGIYIEGDDYVLNGNVIDDLSIQSNVGLCAYLHTKDIYDLIIDNSHLFRPYIGGFWIETKNITTPITFSNCVMEGCGREYNLGDYNTYGCFAINVKSNTDLESVNIDKCYFEANAPIKSAKSKAAVSKTEQFTRDKFEIFVSKPNWEKTADIVMDGPQVTITSSVFSTLYQMVDINNAGKLVFNNNVIYVPEGWKKYNMFTKSIVRVNDNHNTCKNISVSINLENLTNQFLVRNKLDEFNEIKLAKGTLANYISTSVNIPVLGKVYYYTSTSSGISRTNTVYYNSNAEENGIGTPFSPFKYFDTLMKYSNKAFSNGETVKVVLLSDLVVASEVNIPTGMNFIFESNGKTKKIDIRRPLHFYNSDINLNNVTIVKEDGTRGGDKGVFILDDSNIDFKNCSITLNSYSELLSSEKGGKAYFDACTIIPHDKKNHVLIDKSKHTIDVELRNGTKVGGNVDY